MRESSSLPKRANLWQAPTEEQMEMFRKSFPTSDEEMDSGAWFFADECPAGAVWVLKGEGENGEDEYDWT